MSALDLGNLTYLALLLAAVGGYVLASARKNLAKTAQQLLVWGFLFLGIIAVYGLWDDIRNEIAPFQTTGESGAIEVPRSPDGHYYLTLAVNGAPIRFTVDTGASQIVLSQEDAARAGLDPDTLRYSQTAYTANGPVPTAPVILETLRLGDLAAADLMAVVNGGEMDSSLLGMTYLSRFNKIEIQQGRLILTP